MLHSIGVGNMTPAGVKLVYVDLNPAVVTKLADCGSVESVGRSQMWSFSSACWCSSWSG